MHLREISSSARSLLIGEFERSVLCTEEIAGVDLVLNELRKIMREQGAGAARVGATLITNIPVVSRAARCALFAGSTLDLGATRFILFPDKTKSLIEASYGAPVRPTAAFGRARSMPPCATAAGCSARNTRRYSTWRRTAAAPKRIVGQA